MTNIIWTIRLGQTVYGDCKHPCNARAGCEYQAYEEDNARFDTTVKIPHNLADGNYVLQIKSAMSSHPHFYYSCAKVKVRKNSANKPTKVTKVCQWKTFKTNKSAKVYWTLNFPRSLEVIQVWSVLRANLSLSLTVSKVLQWHWRSTLKTLNQLNSVTKRMALGKYTFYINMAFINKFLSESMYNCTWKSEPKHVPPCLG